MYYFMQVIVLMRLNLNTIDMTAIPSPLILNALSVD